jgi:hypothetical protein
VPSRGRTARHGKSPGRLQDPTETRRAESSAAISCCCCHPIRIRGAEARQGKKQKNETGETARLIRRPSFHLTAVALLRQSQRGTRCLLPLHRLPIAVADDGNVTWSRFLPDRRPAIARIPAIPFLMPCTPAHEARSAAPSHLRVATRAARRVGSSPSHGDLHGIGVSPFPRPAGPTPRPRDPPPPRAAADVAVHLSPFG